MKNRSERATETVKIALKNAQNRLLETVGGDRIALGKEYEEWLNPSSFNDDVWFSTDRNLR